MLEGGIAVGGAAIEVGGAEHDLAPIAADPPQLHRPRRRVDREHVPALAVVDPRRVDAGLHPVPGGECPLADQQLGLPERSLGRPQLPRLVVQVGDVAVAAGDHHRVGAGGEIAVPIHKQPIEGGAQIVADDQPPLAAQQVERLRAPALVDQRHHPAVGLAVLAADHLKGRGLHHPGQVAVGTAGADGADLARVADRDQLAPALHREAAKRLQVGGRGGVCLIDDDHRAGVEADPV